MQFLGDMKEIQDLFDNADEDSDYILEREEYKNLIKNDVRSCNFEDIAPNGHSITAR